MSAGMTGIHRAQHASKILVVEDEAIVAMDLKYQLRDMGYEVCGCFDNAHDAIAFAHRQQPDLVLMDIVIRGGIDGVEAANHISRAMNIPVIFLTAYSDDNTIRRAAQAAPYGYLTKPFQTRELHAAIEVALYKSKLEQQLRNSEQWFAATLRCVGDGVVAIDENERISFMNPVAESLLGWHFDEVKGKKADDIVHLEDSSQQPVAIPTREMLTRDAVIGIDFGMLLVARNGDRRPVDDSIAPIRDDRNRVLGAVMVFRDAQERIAAEQLLRQSETRFRSVFDSAPVGMALISLDNHFLQVNAAICKLLGYTENELVGVNQAVFSYSEELEHERGLLYNLISGRSMSEQFEKRFRTCDGKEVWTLVNVSLLLQNQQPFCYLFQIHDVSEQKMVESRLTQLAHYDALTGLANRAMLNDELERAITSARRYNHRLAVIFLDLDYFKQVNDNLGHEAGDELLKIIASRLRASVRETDIVGRLGGDEFVILLPEIRKVADILTVTDKIQSECRKPARIAGQDIQIGISLGASMFPDDAHDSRTLLRYADSALYHAKSHGRSHLQFYRPELTQRMEYRMKLSVGLRQAVERKEFELLYQPIVSLADQTPLAAEALIRWNHPDLGVLEPGSFMPIAEEIGINAAIGEWVLKEACRQAADWAESAAAPIRVAVNLSPSQFKAGNLLEVIRQALKDSSLPADRLCVEITEQLLLNDSERNHGIIQALKDLGVHIAIDDFGIGYSSLSYISHFGPNELKIDRSLIEHLDENAGNASIVAAAISMAHSFKLDIVTEGVETKWQQAFLQQQGCQMAQGFLYSAPRKGGEFISWLQGAGGKAAV